MQVFFKIRCLVWNKERHMNSVQLMYKARTLIGLIRGFWSFLLGRVIFHGDKRAIILGSKIDFDLGPRSIIIISGKNDPKSISDPSNKIFPTASNIGVLPHFEHMNPPVAFPTRLRIRENAKLILEPNTTILIGS